MSIENSTRWGWFCPHRPIGLEKEQGYTQLLLPAGCFGEGLREWGFDRALSRLGSLLPATLTALTHDNFASEQGETIRPNLPPLVSATKAGKRLFSCHALGGRIQRAIYSYLPGCHPLGTLSIIQSNLEGPI